MEKCYVISSTKVCEVCVISAAATDPFAEAIELFLSRCHRRKRPKGRYVFQPGDRGDTLYYVVSGSLNLIAHDPDSTKTVILDSVHPGQFLGELGVFLEKGIPRQLSARTCETSVLAEISYDRFYYFLSIDSAGAALKIVWLLARQLAQRLEKSRRKVEGLSIDNVEARVLKQLRELAELPDAMSHPDGVQIRVTRIALGQMCGCSREYAGRALTALHLAGTIAVSGKTIVLRDATKKHLVRPRSAPFATLGTRQASP